MYKVERASGKGPTRLLHRNLLLPFMFISEIEEVTEKSPLIPMRNTRMKRKTEVCTSSKDESSESDSEQELIIPKRSFSHRKNNAVNTLGVNHNTGLNIPIEHMRSSDYSALSTDAFNVGNDVGRQNQHLDSFSSVEPESFIQSNYCSTISSFDLTDVNQSQP